MADFAIYSALSGRRDWSQVRADRQNELIYLKQMQNDLQNRIQTEAQARAGVVEYMQQINQATVLEGDLERIKSVESDARKKIVEGLKAAGNDYNKFLLGNGAAELQNYYNTVMQSDAMKDAVNNKVNAAQYALDTYMGRQVRPISITMPDGTQKSISFEDQMKMYESGQLNRINYAGSVKPVQLVEIQDAIQKTFGKNPYSRQKASKEDIYEYAQRFGAEDWQAEQLANQYEAGMIQGTETPIYFNYKEPKYGGISDKTWQRMLQQMGGSSDLFGQYLDGTLYKQLKTQEPKKVNWSGKKLDLAYQPMDAETEKKINSITPNLKWDAQRKTNFYMGEVKDPISGKTLKLSGGEDIIPMEYVISTNEDGKNDYWLSAQVAMGNREAKDAGLTNYNWIPYVTGEGIEKTTSFDVKGTALGGLFFGSNEVVGEVLIPVNPNDYYRSVYKFGNPEESRMQEFEMQNILKMMRGDVAIYED